MNKIDIKFRELEGRSAHIGYITAGDPSLEKTEELVYSLEKNGCDIIELGIPYSDPVADGPIIQLAAQRALDNGISIDKIFESVEKIRKNSQVPMAFLVYYNSIYAYGREKFVDRCEEAGIDGLIIPDLPLEEREELLPYLHGKNLGLIPLVAPNSNTRIKDIVANGKGFVYCISSFGVTGMRDNFEVNIKSYLDSVRKETNLPLAVGFGIGTSKDVEKFAKVADGIIVGSAIVDKVGKSGGCGVEVGKFVKDLFTY